MSTEATLGSRARARLPAPGNAPDTPQNMRKENRFPHRKRRREAESLKRDRKRALKTQSTRKTAKSGHEKSLLRHAAGKQLRTKQSEGRRRPAQCTLNGTQTVPCVPCTSSTKAEKTLKKRLRILPRSKPRNTEPPQTEVPQIMTVSAKLPRPVCRTVTRKTRRIVNTVRSGHRAKRQPQQQHSNENSADDIGTEVLMRNTEIGQKTHRAPALRTAETEDAELRTPTVGKDYTARIPSVPVHPSVTVLKQAHCRTRRRHRTPILYEMLDIRAERTKVSAWFRAGLRVAVLSRFTTALPNSLPKPF